MKLLNYTTRVEPHITASEISELLVRNGAVQIMQEFDGEGNVEALRWATEGQYGRLGYSMPVNYDAVFDILTQQGNVYKSDPAKRRQQARRTAWRILKVWVQGQIALVQTGMVDIEEVFLPYMLSRQGDRTLYAALSDRHFTNLDLLTSDAIPLAPPVGN